MPECSGGENVFKKDLFDLTFLNVGVHFAKLAQPPSLAKKVCAKEGFEACFSNNQINQARTFLGFYTQPFGMILMVSIIVGLWRQFEKSLRRIFDIYCHGGHLAKNGNFSPFMALKLLTIKMPS